MTMHARSHRQFLHIRMHNIRLWIAIVLQGGSIVMGSTCVRRHMIVHMHRIHTCTQIWTHMLMPMWCMPCASRQMCVHAHLHAMWIHLHALDVAYHLDALHLDRVDLNCCLAVHVVVVHNQLCMQYLDQLDR